MSLFESPTSFRLRQVASSAFNSTLQRRDIAPADTSPELPIIMATALVSTFADHSSHPNFIHLAGLVCEAVLEVIFVALPGYLVAWTGMFDANSQKFVAELNTMVFTPCLIFTKLASQLNADKLADLGIIPLIFITQTLVSYASAQLMSWAWGFNKKNKKMQKNFIIAMGVFGNSNSLPISLVLSLSKTISGLHWDKIPGDNDDEVAARGILYLMIFQQLGQLLRWTWGYSVLLRPKEAYEDEERQTDEDLEQAEARITEEGRYRDEPEEMAVEEIEERERAEDPHKPIDSAFGSSATSSNSSVEIPRRESSIIPPVSPLDAKRIPSYSSRGSALQNRQRSASHITTFPNFSQSSTHKDFASDDPNYTGWTAPFRRGIHMLQKFIHRISSTLTTFGNNIFRSFPSPVQKVLTFLNRWNSSFWAGVWRQMNPPLWAMLAALIVASVPKLQQIFFTQGTLVHNSVTRAVAQSGGVAVPLILVVLGANLARSTLPQDQLATSPAEKKEERKLLFAALISRMLLPTIVMAPILALVAKNIPVSILDDPIFIIVCFLLTGAPSALQLAQICQINGVFMGAMSSLLVASYVVAIFPSTLVLVLLALEVVEWAVI